MRVEALVAVSAAPSALMVRFGTAPNSLEPEMGDGP